MFICIDVTSYKIHTLVIWLGFFKDGAKLKVPSEIFSPLASWKIPFDTSNVWQVSACTVVNVTLPQGLSNMLKNSFLPNKIEVFGRSNFHKSNLVS